MGKLILSKIILAFTSSIVLAALGAYFFVALSNKETANYLFIACLINFAMGFVLLLLTTKKKTIS